MASTSPKHYLEILFDEKHPCFSLRKILLSEILEIQISPTELCSKVESCQTLTSGTCSLSLEEKLKCCPESSIPANYENFDVELLYKLIKNLCPSLKPTKGWGEKPGAKDTKPGDDVERIIQFREELSKFALTSKFEISKYEYIWDEFELASKRICTLIRRPEHYTFHLFSHFQDMRYRIAECLQNRTEDKPVNVDSSIFEKNPSILHYISGYKDDQIITKVFFRGDSKDEIKAKQDFKEACNPKDTKIEYVNIDYRSKEFLTEAEDIKKMERENEMNKETIIKLEEVIEKNEENIFKRNSTVIGLGISNVRCNGKKIWPEPCIVIYCLDKNIVPFGESPLPPTIGDWPCDHREDFAMFASCPSSCSPGIIEPGCCIGPHNKSVSGSAGFLVESTTDPPKFGFLTAAHVAIGEFKKLYEDNKFLSEHSLKKTKKIILHPYYQDREKKYTEVGCVVEAFCGNYQNKGLDFAFVQSEDRGQTEKETLKIINEAEVVIFNKMENSKVSKTGKSTGNTKGYIHNRKFTLRFWRGKEYYLFLNCYGIQANDDHDHFAKKGDSGSGVFLVENDSILKPLGLYFAYMGRIAVVCKIDTIVKKLGLNIVKYNTT